MIEDLWTHGQREVDAWKDAPVPDLVRHIVGHYHLEDRLLFRRVR